MPSRLAEWMHPFKGAFTAPTWQHVMVLVMGAILVPGRRTVASALRVTGLDQVPHFTNYHRVLNRNKWSARWLSRRLFGLLVAALVPNEEPVVIGLDDTIERRWGARESKSAAFTAIRYAPHAAISSRRVACAGSRLCCCPRSDGLGVAGRYRSSLSWPPRNAIGMSINKDSGSTRSSPIGPGKS